ncbi:MAG: hypothetical protein ACR5KW_04605 [Wolbachia sp.]
MLVRLYHLIMIIKLKLLEVELQDTTLDAEGSANPLVEQYGTIVVVSGAIDVVVEKELYKTPII